jgi:hypothetical protein
MKSQRAKKYRRGVIMAKTQVYQFKVTLRGIRPPIWRRFQVTDDLTFYHFHRVLQEVMGWYGGHLHLFDLNGFQITDAETLDAGFRDGEDGQKARLKQYVRQEGQKFHYVYDFGDDWDHDVLLEKILPVEAGVVYPRCLKGKRACPPEDCGGVWGYETLLEILADPDHAEHGMYMEWVGGEFDPEAFDLEELNEILEELG